MGQSFFDLVYVAARARGTADRDLDAASIDEAALGRGLTTLNEFPSAPYWAVGRVNCDEAEIASVEVGGQPGPWILPQPLR